MSEKPSPPDDRAMPEEIAKLYSKANVPGTRYWDFSASRKEVQGQFRDRIEREHAARAGVEQPPPSTRPAIEQIRSAQFQAGFAPPQDFEAPLSNGFAALAEPAVAPRAPEPRETNHVHHAEVHAPLPQRPAPAAAAAPSGTVAARWYGLQSVFEPAAVIPDVPAMLPTGFAQRPPMVAVVSLAGGVGKTCLVATLGRTLSALGEQVLLADTVSGGLLPFYFGSRDCKPGVLRTFSPPSFASSPVLRTENHVPVQLLNLDPEHFAGNASGPDILLDKLVQDGRGAGRILVDVGTGNREVIHRLLLLQPEVLVPILPDMNSIASLQAMEAMLGRALARGGAARVFYLLNQFDSSSALHRDLREILRVRLGDRLLPVVLRAGSAVSEALADGMTVMDYAPESGIAEDYRNLATWLVRLAAPAVSTPRGARWHER